MTKILCVIGTRPEAIKMAPVVRALKAAPWAQTRLLLTGQHRELLDQALAQFDLGADSDLALMKPNQSLGELTGRAFIALEEALKAEKPDLVLAQGDTTTVMVAALSCFYQRITFGHVEAGLRTGDRLNPFPEEINRVIAGRVSDLHFAPTPAAAEALAKEGVEGPHVLVAGNTVIDNLAYFADRLPPSPFTAPEGGKLILLTSHRRENFGAPMRESFAGIRDAVEAFSNLHVVYPVHPNPNVQAAAAEILGGHARIRLVEPLGYFDFMGAMRAADIIVTDSGGVQEEAPWFSKPVLVLREETERPEAVGAGVARLIGPNRARLLDWITRLMNEPEEYRSMARGVSPYGDGRASDRIVQKIAQHFGHPVSGEILAPFDGRGQAPRAP